MPNKEIIEKWVEALESGEYKQGKGYLNAPKIAGGPYENLDGRLFCCLGVLCDLAVAAEVIPQGVENSDYQKALIYGQQGLGCSLPDEVQAWSGVGNPDPYVKHELSNKPQTLAGLNDQGVKFPEIAAIIRANFLEPV